MICEADPPTMVDDGPSEDGLGHVARFRAVRPRLAGHVRLLAREELAKDSEWLSIGSTQFNSGHACGSIGMASTWTISGKSQESRGPSRVLFGPLGSTLWSCGGCTVRLVTWNTLAYVAKHRQKK